MATRDVKEAEIIGDKIAVTKSGKIAVVGLVGEIIKNNKNGYTLEIVPNQSPLNH